MKYKRPNAYGSDNTKVMLKLSDENRKSQQNSTKLVFRNLVEDLQSDDFLYSLNGSQKYCYSEAKPLNEFEYPWEYSGLPPMNVPLGQIAWTDNELPVLGIHLGEITGIDLKHAMLSLLSEHHRKPFCKFIFLCQNLNILPFLGRYQFAYQYKQQEWLSSDYIHLKHRYAMKQVRNIADGKTIWAF
jgi:hypothetical protein